VALIHNKWIEDIQGPLIPEARISGSASWDQLKAEIWRRRILSVGLALRRAIYSAKSTYNRLQAGSIQFAAADAIWKNGAPLKCKIFMWLSILDKQWTSARHARRGLQNRLDTCSAGRRWPRSSVHAMCPFQASLAHFLWRHGSGGWSTHGNMHAERLIANIARQVLGQDPKEFRCSNHPWLLEPLEEPQCLGV
jgi:hypothetical protein